LSEGLEVLVGSSSAVTVRGQLYKKSGKQKKSDASTPLRLLILEVKKE